MPPRFVVLEHDHPFLHWEFLLEHCDRAFTWRLLSEPGCDRWIEAERIDDHRLLYLTYEGPVSNHRGTVRRLFFGSYESSSDFSAAMLGSPLTAGQWQIPLAGVVPGAFAIMRRFGRPTGHVSVEGDLKNDRLPDNNVEFSNTQVPNSATPGSDGTLRFAVLSAGPELPVAQPEKTVTTDNGQTVDNCQTVEQWRFSFSSQIA